MTNDEKIATLIQHGVRQLARAAAIAEIESVNDDTNISNDTAIILWTQIRSLCAEHGIGYEATIQSARRIAPNIISNAVNVI